ncbi:hypothetical protein HPP92_011248 [Vanilla planifolia]|uniref:Uncharacterized protein n=1 Tax=Vanilla planifolia TaxID=51239 RepID=A0A835R6P1_VANPL|nr:hypothetical protein HPP92_011248 [Vanilla planifolia]
MDPEDRSWLEMDIEDTLYFVGGNREIPFYENDEWVEIYGENQRKVDIGYAGQWKYGQWLVVGYLKEGSTLTTFEDSSGCDSDVSLHAGIAEVAAAKARMFINKPDRWLERNEAHMVILNIRISTLDDDAWMAPGFINQFYDTMEEVRKANVVEPFYKAPLRIPMPAELEHWWSKDPDDAEFILINQEPEPDPQDPSKLIYREDPLILHTPSGRLINYVEDEKYGLRLFWQPHLKEDEDVDPDKAVFLPLGFDEFYGRAPPSEKKPPFFPGLLMSAGAAVRLVLERLDRWVEEKKKAGETRRGLIEKELEYIEAEICMEEALEDLEMELKMQEEEEEAKNFQDE